MIEGGNAPASGSASKRSSYRGHCIVHVSQESDTLRDPCPRLCSSGVQHTAHSSCSGHRPRWNPSKLGGSGHNVVCR